MWKYPLLSGAVMILIDRQIDTLDSTEALDGIISKNCWIRLLQEGEKCKSYYQDILSTVGWVSYI